LSTPQPLLLSTPPAPGLPIDADDILDFGAWRNDGYRMAAKVLHPDAGGSTEDFQKLQEAKRLLDEALA
jgi:hypothetical protein